MTCLSVPLEAPMLDTAGAGTSRIAQQLSGQLQAWSWAWIDNNQENLCRVTVTLCMLRAIHTKNNNSGAKNTLHAPAVSAA